MRYRLTPEVAGRVGTETIWDVSVHPPLITHLHYELQGWLGGALLESFPCYIVTAALGEDLLRHGFTGFELSEVYLTVDPQYEMFSPNGVAALPEFLWLKIVGEEDSDFRFESDGLTLSVSSNVVGMINKHGIGYGEVSEAVG